MSKNLITTLNNYIKENSNNLNSNFWKWFGKSKIKIKTEPLICYHGTDKTIESFDFSKIGQGSGNFGHYGYGMYFSEDIREAAIYGKNIHKCYLKIENPFTGTDDEIIKLKENGISNIDELEPISIDFNSFKNEFKGTYIYQFLTNVELNGLEFAWDNLEVRDDLDKLNDISNIIEYTTLNPNVRGVPDYVFDILNDLKINPKVNKGFLIYQSLHWITDLGNRSKEVTDTIKKLGYDGVWYGSEIVAFHPTQIKSIDNDGTWDSNDENIYS